LLIHASYEGKSTSLVPRQILAL